MTMTFKDSDRRRKHSSANVGRPIQWLIISTSGHMFGTNISSNEFPREIFESIGDFPSVLLGVIVAHLVGGHVQKANRNGPITSLESRIRFCVF